MCRNRPADRLLFGSAVLGSSRSVPRGGRSVCECRVVFPSRHRARMPYPLGARPRPARCGTGYSVISCRALVSSDAADPGPADCITISLVMSPWTMIRPAMNASMAAWGLPSTKIARAVS